MKRVETHDRSLDSSTPPLETPSGHSHENNTEIIQDFVETRKLTPYESFMFWVWNSFEQETPTNFGIILNLFITGVVFINVVLIMLRTEEAIHKNLTASSILFVGEILCGLILTIELACRIWGSYEALKYQKIHPALRRFRFLCTFWAIFDCINVTTQCFYLTFASVEYIIGNSNWLASWLVIVFRIIRFLRLLRAQKTFNGFKILKNVFKAKWRELLVSFVLLICVTLGLSSIVYFFERDIQPEALGSIPRAFYFTMVTMSTIGYGDITCKTWAARGIVSGVVLWNLFLFSIPITIIAAGIVEEMTKETMAAEMTLERQRASMRRHLADWKHGLDVQRKLIQPTLSHAFITPVASPRPKNHQLKKNVLEKDFEMITPTPTPTLPEASPKPNTGTMKDLMEHEEDKKIEEFMKNIQNDEYLDKVVEKGLIGETIRPEHISSMEMDPSLGTNLQKQEPSHPVPMRLNPIPTITIEPLKENKNEPTVEPNKDKLIEEKTTPLKESQEKHVEEKSPVPTSPSLPPVPVDKPVQKDKEIVHFHPSSVTLVPRGSLLDVAKLSSRNSDVSHELSPKKRQQNIIRMMEEFEIEYLKLHPNIKPTKPHKK